MGQEMIMGGRGELYGMFKNSFIYVVIFEQRVEEIGFCIKFGGKFQLKEIEYKGFEVITCLVWLRISIQSRVVGME